MIYDTENKDIIIILLGESGTGKSNLINICCDLNFNKNSVPNYSTSILDKKVRINNIQYNLQFGIQPAKKNFVH